MPTIYNYIDYRKFLADFINEKKKSRSSYSYRQFGLRCGLSTSNYIQKVINEERNLGPDRILKFSKAINLNKKETEYFNYLVLFNQTKDKKLKLDYYNELDKIKAKNGSFERTNFVTINRKWYYPVIWELVSCEDFKLTAENIVKALDGRITKRQSNEAIKFLLNNNLIKIVNEKYVQNGLPITAEDDVKNLLLQEFHIQMARKAEEAITNQSVYQREFQGLTIALSKEKLNLLKRKIKEFAFELHKELANDPKAKAVYQININAFCVANLD